jgi:hypothetical protein
VSFDEASSLHGQRNTQAHNHNEDIPRKQDIDNFVDLTLFEFVAALIQDLFGVLTRIQYHHVEVAGLANLASSRYELLQIQLGDRLLLIFKNDFHLSILK